MIVLFPLTKFLIGKSIGTTAAIIPLTIGAAPFIARLIESAFKEVDKGVIEAAKSFGASDFQIVFKVMLVEALPSIISAITLTLITVIGFSAMAGAVGGGGLGDVAIKYGYYRLNLKVNGKSYDKTIHNLVALAFINNPLNKKQVNHINGIKTDNRVENLEWCTAKENIKHAVKNRLIKTKLTDKQALEIYNSSETQRFLGNKYNVNPVIVWRIKNKKAYKHIF